MNPILIAAAAGLVAVIDVVPVHAGDLRVAVTTSFHNSGLSDILLPAIRADLGFEVRLLVVGTGQALRLGSAGDVDAVLVHSRAAEEAFVASGHGTHRREIMYNDFVIVGPAANPASIDATQSLTEALRNIAEFGAAFVSRGDDSGTHRRELVLWQAVGIDVTEGNANWYRAAGAGMGATLNIASGMNAYVLADRASWLNFVNKGDLLIVFEGDPALYNQYAFLPVNPARHPHVEFELAARLEDWLTAAKTQQMIGAYSINGEQLFVPNATQSGAGTDG